MNMDESTQHPQKRISITTRSIINLLGVVYAHTRMGDEGDLYLTEFGLRYADMLDIRNWFERDWFISQRERLSGTSSVYRVPTKEVNGRRLHLVVKNNRVGEDVPCDTHTLTEFMNAEFNSPWEEFALTLELRENRAAPTVTGIKTQQPLAIYVPSEKLQLWQTGRSREKINKIVRRHPTINLDILRQYKMVYQWIEGLNIVEALTEVGVSSNELTQLLNFFTDKTISDLEANGFIVADMKPSHIIISEKLLQRMRRECISGAIEGKHAQVDYLKTLVERGDYSLIDYELLIRTPKHEEEVKHKRRHIYLDDQRDRFHASQLPPFLVHNEIMGVPYVHGHVESTGGLLWVVGRNPRLFDYFLPERWRKTPCQSFSDTHEVFYTVSKDNIHVVWKTSRIGEEPQPGEGGKEYDLIREYGINSPFEEFAIAHRLTSLGIPTVYVRAIYMTGSTKTEPILDKRPYVSHAGIVGFDGLPVLRGDHEYITIRGYYNGADSWVASHEGQLCSPYNLLQAGNNMILTRHDCLKLLETTRARLLNVGYDGSLLKLNDIIISIDPSGNIMKDNENLPEARICNFELIHKRES